MGNSKIASLIYAFRMLTKCGPGIDATKLTGLLIVTAMPMNRNQSPY
jgi:hypothetical protein